MCLDWTGEHEAAAMYFEKAEALDPNGYYTEAHVGWHYFQIEDFITAKKHLERSLSLFANEKLNPIPYTYLKLIAEKLKDAPADK